VRLARSLGIIAWARFWPCPRFERMLHDPVWSVRRSQRAGRSAHPEALPGVLASSHAARRGLSAVLLALSKIFRAPSRKINCCCGPSRRRAPCGALARRLSLPLNRKSGVAQAALIVAGAFGLEEMRDRGRGVFRPGWPYYWADESLSLLALARAGLAERRAARPDTCAGPASRS